ncbi:ATPase PAAT-like [Glandiceps talaboti]
MERLQNCWANISWNQDSAGFDINSVLHRVMKDDSNDPEELETMATRGISLSAPSSSDKTSDPCLLNLTCQPSFDIVAIVTISEAKHTEVYSSGSDYCGTVRGQRLNMDENDANRADVLYKGEWTFQNPVKECSVKFLSLKDKQQMWLYYVKVVLEQSTEPQSSLSTSGVLPSQHSIDMSQVRHLLDSMNQDTDEKTEKLMSSIEDYQKNQSAMYEDIHSLMKDSMTSPAATVGGTTSKTSEAIGMLGMLSKLSLLQNTQTQQAASSNFPPIPGSMAIPDHGNDSDNAAMFSMLKNVCCEVTKMRENSKQKEDRQELADTENRKEGLNDANSIGKETGLSSSETPGDVILQIEERLMQKIEEAEQRIVNRVERRLTELQTHLDTRLDGIMAILCDRTISNTSDLPVD